MTKGTVVAAFAVGNSVKVWVASPTGDSSDSQIFEIQCLDKSQADFVAEMWRSTWKLTVGSLAS